MRAPQGRCDRPLLGRGWLSERPGVVGRVAPRRGLACAHEADHRDWNHDHTHSARLVDRAAGERVRPSRWRSVQHTWARARTLGVREFQDAIDREPKGGCWPMPLPGSFGSGPRIGWTELLVEPVWPVLLHQVNRHKQPPPTPRTCPGPRTPPDRPYGHITSARLPRGEGHPAGEVPAYPTQSKGANRCSRQVPRRCVAGRCSSCWRVAHGGRWDRTPRWTATPPSRVRRPLWIR